MSFRPAYVPIGVGTFHLESARNEFDKSISLLRNIDSGFSVPDDMLLSIDKLEAYLDGLNPDFIIVQNLTFANAAYIYEVLRRFVDLGIMPVMFGDVVLDRKLGFAILSGDQIMERLTDIFDIDQVIFVSDIDGLFDDDPKTNPSARMYGTVDQRTLESVRSDISVDAVTGEENEKMKAMLRMCSDKRECILVNGNAEGRLLSLLKGEDVICTKATGGII